MLVRLLVAALLVPVVLTAQARIASPGRTGLSISVPAGPPVGGIRVTSTQSSISLRWSCSTGATGYEVLGAPPGGGALIKLTGTPLSPNCVQDLQAPAINPGIRNAPPGAGTPQTTWSTGFTHGGLTPATEFVYVVRALYPGGAVDSDPVPARASAWSPPTGLRASTNPTGPFLSWDQMYNMYGSFVVSRRPAGQGAFTPIATVPYHVLYYADNGRSPGVYEYIVQAVGGDPSAPLVFRAGKPLLSMHVIQGEPGFDVYWGGVYPGASMSVAASASAAGPFADVTPQGTFGQRDWTSGTGQPGTTRYFRVTATYPGNLVMDSDPIAVSIPAAPPGPTKGQATYTPNNVRLTWTCDPFAKDYTLQRQWPNGSRPYLLDRDKKPLTIKGCGYIDYEPVRGMLNVYVIVAFYQDPRMRRRETTTVVNVP